MRSIDILSILLIIAVEQKIAKLNNFKIRNSTFKQIIAELF